MARDNSTENPHRSPVPVAIPSSLPASVIRPDGQERAARGVARQAIVDAAIRDRATPRSQETL